MLPPYPPYLKKTEDERRDCMQTHAQRERERERDICKVERIKNPLAPGETGRILGGGKGGDLRIRI